MPIIEKHTRSSGGYSLIICWIAVAIFLFDLFLQGLADGGRWDLYEPIAMADRWSTGFGYSIGIEDFYKSSTPYFPGVSILAFAFTKLGAYQVDFLLFVASLLVVVLLFLLNFLYKKIGGVWPLHAFLVFSISISHFILYEWLSYAKEFKPDTVALVFLLIGILSYFSNSALWLRRGLLIAAFAFALVFKQQIIAAEVGFVLALLFANNSPRAKLIDAFIVVCALGLGLLPIFLLDGGAFFAVNSHIGRGFIPLSISINNAEHKKLAYQLLVLFVGSFILFGKNYFWKSFLMIFENYNIAIPAFCWFVACFLGAINYGGNIGNTAVGLVLFIPFIAIFFDKINSNYVGLLALCLTISLINNLIWGAWKQKLHARLALDAEISLLVTNAKPRSILISGDSYIAVRSADVKRVSEIDTWAHIRNGVNKSLVPYSGDAFIKQLNPDMVICVQGCDIFNELYSISPERAGYKEVVLKASNRQRVLFVKNDTVN